RKHVVCAALLLRSWRVVRTAEMQNSVCFSYTLILRGWALAEQMQEEDGITLIRQCLAAFQATGAALFMTYSLALLAEVYRRTGQADAGLRVLHEALTLMDKHDERFYAAELHRLKNELLLRQTAPDAAEVEACFQQAFAIARRQQAKSLELRATM